MKRERPQDHNHSNGLFSHHHHHHHHLFPTPPHLRHSSEENDSREADSPSPFPPPPPQTADGSSIEIVRRPRGRPPGSKNKPKPSAVAAAVAAEPLEPPMGPYILEIPPGVDVIESTARFCRRRNVGLCILNGHGAVSSVSLRQPSATPAAAATFHGRFDILSVSATILPAGGLPSGNGAFTVFLSGPQGQVVGGLVVGPLVSACTVYLIAATFNGPTYLRLAAPGEQDDDSAARDSGGGGVGYDLHESPHGGDSGSGRGGAPIYSYQPSDVIWAPSARQAVPPPHPPPY